MHMGKEGEDDEIDSFLARASERLAGEEPGPVDELTKSIGQALALQQPVLDTLWQNIGAGRVIVPPALVAGKEVTFIRRAGSEGLRYDFGEITDAVIHAYRQDPRAPIVINIPGTTAFAAEEIQNRDRPIPSGDFWRTYLTRTLPADLLREYGIQFTTGFKITSEIDPEDPAQLPEYQITLTASQRRARA